MIAKLLSMIAGTRNVGKYENVSKTNMGEQGDIIEISKNEHREHALKNLSSKRTKYETKKIVRWADEMKQKPQKQ